MADDAQRARALGAWEAALVAYLDAADAMIRHGALASPHEPLELDLVEVLNVEQGDALQQCLQLPRGLVGVRKLIDGTSPASTKRLTAPPTQSGAHRLHRAAE